MTTPSTLQSRIEEFMVWLGACFSFPPNVDNATGYAKDRDGIPQAYAGRWDSKSIEDFIKGIAHLAKEEGKQEGREAERKDILKLVKEYDWDELGSDGHTILVRKNGIVGLITSRSNIGKV